MKHQNLPKWNKFTNYANRTSPRNKLLWSLQRKVGMMKREILGKFWSSCAKSCKDHVIRKEKRGYKDKWNKSYQKFSELDYLSSFQPRSLSVHESVFFLCYWLLYGGLNVNKTLHLAFWLPLQINEKIKIVPEIMFEICMAFKSGPLILKLDLLLVTNKTHFFIIIDLISFLFKLRNEKVKFLIDENTQKK